jgi:hypothetical protein
MTSCCYRIPPCGLFGKLPQGKNKKSKNTNVFFSSSRSHDLSEYKEILMNFFSSSILAPLESSEMEKRA